MNNELKLAAKVTALTIQNQELNRRNRNLARRNTELRARVCKLEQARDKWRARATGYRTTVNRLRSKVADSRRSRDLWKTRYQRDHSGL